MRRVSLFMFVFVFAGFCSCRKAGQYDQYPEIFLDMEIADDSTLLARTDTSVHFDDLAFRSKIESRSGEFSLITSNQFNTYALSFIQNKEIVDIFIHASIWRKSPNGAGALVIQSVDNSYNIVSSTPVEKGPDGWERIELQGVIPSNAQFEQLNIFVWNPGSDTVFFDDLIIRRSLKKTYPEYAGENLVLVLDTSEYIKLKGKREQAFQNGILQTADDDWVKSILFGDDKIMKAKIRLKGDWLDHLREDKWSFRIKIRDENTWNRLRVFSVHTPFARGYLREWISHKFYHSKDILTTRYGFIPIVFNNRSIGYYAWEEHFDKILPEWNKRREGPILKISDEAYWQWIKSRIDNRPERSELPNFDVAVIKPFSSGKIISDTNLFKQFLNGQILLYQYKNRLRPPSEIFDIKKMAAYYAMSDLLDNIHGIGWNNIRFYFNPVLCKLEPIAFDCFSGFLFDHCAHSELLFGMKYILNDELYKEEALIQSVFLDDTFLKHYLDYLEEFSDTSYVLSLQRALQPELTYYDSMIRIEFPKYKYNKNFLYDNALYIRDQLPVLSELIRDKKENQNIKANVIQETYHDSIVFEDTPGFYLNAYTEYRSEDSLFISLHNYYPKDLIILGTGVKSDHIEYYLHPEPVIGQFDGSKEAEVLNIKTPLNAEYIYFMLRDGFQTYKAPVNPWPHPEGDTPQQELMLGVNLQDKNIFDTIIDNKDIYIRNSSITVENHIVVPEGYILHFKPGTKLDLVKGAAFLSYSPVIMQGTEENEILITSSDSSANGFTVLQAKGKSMLNYVRFEKLNTLDIGGWTLTGSVNFYESDVEISNVTFLNNYCEDALNTIRSDFKVIDSRFENIFGDAFDSDFCDGEVVSTSFNTIGNDAIDFSGSNILIEDVSIDKTLDKGISGGEESTLRINKTSINNANIGLASKDYSYVEISNSRISDCKYSLVIFRKKPEFGPARISVNNTSLINIEYGSLVEIGSELLIDDKSYEGDKINVADFLY